MFLTHTASAILTLALIALFWIDFRTYRLPDAITLPLIAAGIAVNALLFDSLWPSVVGAAAGYGAFVTVELGFRRLTGRHGLGRGDAKLAAAGGAWCGGWLLPAVVLVGTGSALLFIAVEALAKRRLPERGTAHAFGPWLAVGIAVGWMYRAYGPGLYPAL